MALRDDLIALVDDVRQGVIADALGLRLHVVATRTRTWAGVEKGIGGYSDVAVTLAPPPRVRPAMPVKSGEAGKRELGEVVVDRISATYTADDLFPEGLGPAVEFAWLVDGLEYVPVDRPRAGYLGWSIRLSRVGGRR